MLRETGLLDRALRGVHVVADALEHRPLGAAVIVEVELEPRGPGIAVTRLADGAGVQERVAAAAQVVDRVGAGLPADQALVDQPRGEPW